MRGLPHFRLDVDVNRSIINGGMFAQNAMQIAANLLDQARGDNLMMSLQISRRLDRIKCVQKNERSGNFERFSFYIDESCIG